MADEEEQTEEEVKKPSKLPLILGVVLALAGGGGGFFATYSGMILGSGEEDADHASEPKIALEAVDDISFIPVDPMVVSLGGIASDQHLRFRAQLEVPLAYKADVELLMPRIVDVLNNYLRALQLTDLQDNSALLRLRSQMLRRVQVVAGQERISDLLIMEFLLN